MRLLADPQLRIGACLLVELSMPIQHKAMPILDFTAEPAFMTWEVPSWSGCGRHMQLQAEINITLDES